MSSPRLGMHVMSKAGNQFFQGQSVERQLIVDTWRAMGVTDLKLLTDGDSQKESAKYLVGQGFRLMVRFYHTPICLDAVPDDQLKPFMDVGVTVFEGYTNEPEIEWRGKPPNADTIDALARAHIRFADACYRCNGMKPGIWPLTPAIQGDRVYSWFEPMVQRIIDLGRKDALEGSYIACHPRPENNLPDATPPGFCPRSYELFDDVVVKHIGHSLPIYATEWGYEPGDHDNTTLPVIDLDLHAKYNVQLAQMANWRPCLQVGFYWLWMNDWFNSGWWRGSVESSLPVVRAFIALRKAPKPPEPVPTLAERVGGLWGKDADWGERAIPIIREAAHG
jgi:hypothetical protein